MQIGDEIVQINRNRKGMILEIDWPLYLVMWITEDDKPATGETWINEKYIKLAPVDIPALEYFALLDEIDAALDSRDQKTFMALTEILKVVRP